MSSVAAPPAGIECALLGLLRGQPMHAYELHQRLLHAEALGLVWRLKQGHLYALLNKLEAAGYLAGSLEAQGSRPPRKILRVTPQGERAFSQWSKAPVQHGRDFRLEFLAKLFFAAADGAETVRALVEQQRCTCEGWLADLRAQVERVSRERRYDRLVLRFRIGQIEAIVPWLDQCERELAPPAG